MDFGEGDDFLGKTPDKYAMGDRVFCDTNFGRSKRGVLDCEGRVWAWDERSSLLIVPGVLLRCFFFYVYSLGVLARMLTAGWNSEWLGR